MSAWSDYLTRVAGELPQKKLAALAGVDPSQVSRWMAGSTLPSVKAVDQLVTALHLDEDEARVAAGQFQHRIEASDEDIRTVETALIPIEGALEHLRTVADLVNTLPLGQLAPEVQEQVDRVRASTGSMLMMVSSGAEPGAAPSYQDVLLELVMATFVNEPQTRSEMQRRMVVSRNYRVRNKLTNVGAYAHILNDPRLDKQAEPNNSSESSGT